MNFKRKKPHSKIYRGGCGNGCSWCASNYYYEKYEKLHLVKWELNSECAIRTHIKQTYED